jgi:hypothetical protein
MGQQSTGLDETLHASGEIVHRGIDQGDDQYLLIVRQFPAQDQLRRQQ